MQDKKEGDLELREKEITKSGQAEELTGKEEISLDSKDSVDLFFIGQLNQLSIIFNFII